MSMLHDDDARAAIAAGRSGLSCETCGCGRIHIRLRYHGEIVGECVGTVEQVADAADVLRHVAQHLGPGFASQYAAPALAEGCIVLAPGRATGNARLALGSDRVACVSIDVSAEELTGISGSFADAARRSAEARTAQDDRFEHAKLDASVLASVEAVPDCTCSAGCPCGRVHVYSVRAGAIVLRLDLTPDEARLMAAGVSASVTDAEGLAASAPKPN